MNEFDNGEVYGSVAYSWGGVDSPFHFNSDLLDQRDCINLYYRNVYNTWTNFYPDLPPDNAGNGDYWLETTSPTGNWDGYIFGTPTNNADYIWIPITIQNDPNSPYHPYTPNFGTYRDFIVGDYVDGETDIYTTYAAGVDCSGFIQRAANYAGNTYTTGNVSTDRLEWRTTPWTWQGKTNPEKWDIAVNSNERHLIIPGDIFYTPGHASIVLKIAYGENSREVLPANVTLIEAGYVRGRYMVTNNQTWGIHYPYNEATQKLGRLRTSE